MKYDRYSIISVLTGLVHACGNNPKTENTDEVVIHGLAAFYELSQKENPEEALISEAEFKKIAAEKYMVSPDCATCKHPCGNTTDYDMDQLWNAEITVKESKLNLINACAKMAAVISTGEFSGDRAKAQELIDQGLSFVGWDFETEYMDSIAGDLKKLTEE